MPWHAVLVETPAVMRLSEAQRAHLLRWGYPYVMDEFRFHMSLTGSLAQVDAPTQSLVFEAELETVD